MSDYVRRVAVFIAMKKGPPRIVKYLADLTDDGVDWTPLRARAACYWDARGAHAACGEVRKREGDLLMVRDVAGAAAAFGYVRVVRARLPR